jgi:ribosomal protein S18 acetylase RimI-like enzyme
VQIDIPSIVSRTETSADQAFLFDLYASTRKEELDLWGWPPEMRNSFLRLQFKAQQSYRTAFPKAQFKVLSLNGDSIGRTVIDRSAEEIRLVDIALLPDYRNRGVGTALLKKLCAEAAAARKPLRLSVVKGHRAASLYRRLGFQPAGESGMHDHMEWRDPKTP